MCQAIREMIEDGREEGREEGRKAGRREEQKNTERERLRAIAAERKVSELQEELQRLRTQLGIA